MSATQTNSTDEWINALPPLAPKSRIGTAAVWTGRELIVWGGQEVVWNIGLRWIDLREGERYDPVANELREIETNNSPAGGWVTGVWTGTEMIVWLGPRAGRYNPATDSWRSMNTNGAPSLSSFPEAIWTGSEMIVWGGGTGRYDPARDLWLPMSTNGTPKNNWFATIVWTGREMIVWGGAEESESAALRSGARYNPELDRWFPMTESGAPSGRKTPGIWTGKEMIVWGGIADGVLLNDGGRYDPVNDRWLPVSTNAAPAARGAHIAVWTGLEMIVWGGGTNTGGRYDPDTDSWSPMTMSGAPSAPVGPVWDAVWTGSEMLVYDYEKGVSMYRPRPPSLTIGTRDSNRERIITWPYPFGGYHLEENSSPTGGGWTQSNRAPSVAGSKWEVKIPSDSGQTFFRLAK